MEDRTGAARAETPQRVTLEYVLNDFLLARTVPAALFSLLLLAKVVALIGFVQAVVAWEPYSLTVLLQRTATIVFLALVVLLFMTRRPVIGRRSSLAGAVVALAGTFIMSVPVVAPFTNPSGLAMAASAALTLAGTAFSIASLASLGRCFGIFPEARGLVAKGPYRWVRHPLYVGEATSTLGQVVVTASPAMVALFLAFVVLQAWRAANEERALAAVFPEYADYAGRTKRFFPGLY